MTAADFTSRRSPKLVQSFARIALAANCDMYISGELNVYARELEEVLPTHPDVAEVAVLGVPNPKWGESGWRWSCGGKVLSSTGSLLGHLENRCARYRWQHHIFFWDALPRSGYGKVTKNEIRHQLLERGELQHDM